MKYVELTTLAAMVSLMASCAKVSVDPIKVEPIYITVDVNIRVQRDLESFFDFEDEVLKGTSPSTTAATQPAAKVEVKKTETIEK